MAGSNTCRCHVRNVMADGEALPTTMRAHVVGDVRDGGVRTSEVDALHVDEGAEASVSVDRRYSTRTRIKQSIRLEEWDLGFLSRWCGCTVRTLDKVCFCFGVANALTEAYFFGGWHAQQVLFYTAKAPILITARLVYYWFKRWHYFMLDFCYFCNAALLLYLWVWPESKALFTVVFSLVNGPIAFAVIAFSNALVFHSVDKITSLFIHMTPVLVTHSVRFYSKEIAAAGLLGGRQRYAVCEPDDASCSGLLYTYAIPLACYAAHQVLLLLLTACICPIPRDKRFLSSFRYLAMRERGALYKITRACGNSAVRQVFIYGLINIGFTAVVLLPSTLWYRSYYAQFLFILVIGSVCVWNGATFYFERFQAAVSAKSSSRGVTASKQLLSSDAIGDAGDIGRAFTSAQPPSPAASASLKAEAEAATDQLARSGGNYNNEKPSPATQV